MQIILWNTGAPAIEVGRVPDGTIPSIAMQQKWTDVSKKRFCDDWEASVRDAIARKQNRKASDGGEYIQI